MRLAIDPKNDYAFKKLFGSPENADLLTELLEAVLGLPAGTLREVRVTNPFNEKETTDDKLSVLDIKARDKEGRGYNVEMQMVLRVALVPRLVYYWAVVHGRQLNEGQDFRQLKPTAGICFLNGRLADGEGERYHRRAALVDLDSGKPWTDHLQMHVVELGRFALRAEDVRDPLQRWCYFLKHWADLDSDKLPPAVNVPAIHKAMGVLMNMGMNDAEFAAYLSRDMAVRDKLTEENLRAELVSDNENLKWQKAEAERQKAEAEARAAAAELRGQKAAFAATIRAFESVLRQPPTSEAELLTRSLDELRRVADDLQRQAVPPSA